LSREVVRLLLPFAVPAPERRRKASREITLAAIFSITEAEREKGGGLILKRPPEEVLFISEVCYPFWMYPLGNRVLLFEGFGILRHKIPFDILPDTRVFQKEMETSSERLEMYLAFLNHNLNYFKGFLGSGKKQVEGLVADPNFIKDFVSYLESAKRVKDVIPDRVILAPRIDVDVIEETVKGIHEFMRTLEADMKSLRNIIRTLTNKTQKHINALKLGNERIKRRAEREIARVKKKLEKRITVLKRAYDEKVFKASRDAEQQIQRLREEKSNLEARKERLKAYLEQCRNEISNCKARKDDEGLEHWTTEYENSKKEVREIKKKVDELDAEIRRVEASRDREVSKLRTEYDAEISQGDAEVRRIEAIRDSEIKAKEETIKTLKDLTSKIVSQISGLIDSRRPRPADILEIGVPMIKRKLTMVYMPFFLVCYKRGSKRRYRVFPPSLMSSYGVAARFKGALGAQKVGMILRERSRPISTLINRFVDIVETEPLLERRIRSACVKSNILRMRRTRKMIIDGLSELFGEGWINEMELKTLNEELTRPRA